MEKVNASNIIVEMADEFYNEGKADVAYRLLRRWLVEEESYQEQWAREMNAMGYSYIELIKEYRVRFNCILAEAKEEVDKLFKEGKLKRR